MVIEQAKEVLKIEAQSILSMNSRMAKRKVHVCGPTPSISNNRSLG